MRKRIIAVLVAIAACLVFAGTAAASVDTNITASVKRVQDGFPKWVLIDGTHTASGGTFTGEMCSRQVVFSDGSIVWLSGYFVFTINRSVYGNNGNTVDMGTVTDTGKGC